MAIIQEISPPSTSSVYNNLRSSMQTLSHGLASSVFERITQYMDLSGSMTFTQFFNENDFTKSSKLHHVFDSEHYREQIFRDAEELLRKHGYECRFAANTSSRLRSIIYDVRVIPPMRRAVSYLLSMAVPVMFAYGATYLGTYVYQQYYQRQQQQPM